MVRSFHFASAFLLCRVRSVMVLGTRPMISNVHAAGHDVQEAALLPTPSACCLRPSSARRVQLGV